jgi:hypothetical protein
MNSLPSHPAALDVARLLSECRIERGRRSGPGGQHRNKVETAIRICHQPSGITSEATERRSQEQNQQVAVRRLRLQLALHVRGTRQADEAPSSLWVSRCRGGRIAVSRDHEDFPALLAEAMDVLVACDMDTRRAAESLRVTPTQLTRLLKLEPHALPLVNKQRAIRGLHRLH